MTLFVVGGPMVLFCVFALGVMKLQTANAKAMQATVEQLAARFADETATNQAATRDQVEALLGRSEQQETRYQDRMRVMFESLMTVHSSTTETIRQLSATVGAVAESVRSLRAIVDRLVPHDAHHEEH